MQGESTSTVIYVWGKNVNGQLGLAEKRQTASRATASKTAALSQEQQRQQHDEEEMPPVGDWLPQQRDEYTGAAGQLKLMTSEDPLGESKSSRSSGARRPKNDGRSRKKNKSKKNLPSAAGSSCTLSRGWPS